MITEMTISTNAFSSLSYNELMDIEAGGLFSKIASNVGCVLIGAGGIVGGVCLMAVPEPTPVICAQNSVPRFTYEFDAAKFSILEIDANEYFCAAVPLLVYI